MSTTLRTTIVLGTITLLLACSHAVALDGQLALTNAALVVSVNTSNATFSVLDRRTGRLWTQRAGRAEVAVTEAHAGSNEIDLGPPTVATRRSVPQLLLLLDIAIVGLGAEEFSCQLGDGCPCPQHFRIVDSRGFQLVDFSLQVSQDMGSLPSVLEHHYEQFVRRRSFELPGDAMDRDYRGDSKR
jgi:hypothetical protein